MTHPFRNPTTPTFALRLAAFACLALGTPSFALADASTEAVGFSRIAAPGNSDTIVSLPFKRTAAFVGKISSVADNVITVQGSPAWATAPQQFAYATGTQPNTYYAFIKSGPREGTYFTITGNGSNTLTLDLAGSDLAGVDNTTALEVVPYWTLGTVFPGGSGVNASTDESHRQTDILVPDVAANGINVPAAKTYFFAGGHWQQVGQGAASRDDDCLLPDSFLTIRHKVSAGTFLNPAGEVVFTKLAVALATSATGRQDNFVALARPVPVSLDNSGLITSGAFSSSPNNLARTDELLFFDNIAAKTGKSASAVYFYAGGMWRKVGSGNTNVGATNVFMPGTGVVIRKNSTVGGATAIWSNTPTYSN
ncbi:MAG: TIGR02597 family protein [Chthoniobacterales bacterium]